MIHIYHPNKAVKGFACSFWYSDRDQSVYATLIKQAGWDDRTKNGTFKASLNDPTKKVNIKLSFTEVGGILDCIERNRPFSQYHDSDASPKQISFTPMMSKAWTDAADVAHPATQSGFSFTVSVIDKQDTTQKNPFYIALTFAEARYIREYLLFCIHKYFNSFQNRQTPSIQDLSESTERVGVAAQTAQAAIETLTNTVEEQESPNNSESQDVKDPLTGL